MGMRAIFDALRDAGVNFLGHGLDMDTPHHSLSEAWRIIRQSVDKLSEASRQDITGWISPGRFESVTPDLLSEAGIQFFADWVNDDMPYIFKTVQALIDAIYKLEDSLLCWRIFIQRHHMGSN